MKTRFLFSKLLVLIPMVLLVCLSACATPSKVVEHSFEFDMSKDHQDADVLDYRYGNSKLPVHAPEWRVAKGEPVNGNSVFGPMLKGDFLYVKWRNRNTGKVYEDTVDLRHRLPADITGDTVTFMIYGAQLYVYLVTTQKRPINEQPIGPHLYRHLKVHQIYPDSVQK